MTSLGPPPPRKPDFLQIFARQLRKVSNNLEEIKVNIGRSENNAQRIRINPEMDTYEDILIANIEAIEKEAQRSQD